MARELQVVRVHGRKLGVDGLEAAAELERDEEGRHGRDHHQHALNDVGHHDRADAARHAVEDDRDTHHDDADPLRSARVGREDHARADRLRAHHGHEEDEHQDGEQAPDGGRLITVGKIVGHREHLVAVAELDEPAADEKRGDDHREGDARHRDAHAGVADVVDRARNAHEGRHRVLRREVRKTREHGASRARHREEVLQISVLAVAPPADKAENDKVADRDDQKGNGGRFNLIRHDASPRIPGIRDASCSCATREQSFLSPAARRPASSR